MVKHRLLSRPMRLAILAALVFTIAGGYVLANAPKARASIIPDGGGCAGNTYGIWGEKICVDGPYYDSHGAYYKAYTTCWVDYYYAPWDVFGIYYDVDCTLWSGYFSGIIDYETGYGWEAENVFTNPGASTNLQTVILRPNQGVSVEIDRGSGSQVLEDMGPDCGRNSECAKLLSAPPPGIDTYVVAPSG